MKMKYSNGRDLQKGRSAEGKNLNRTDSIMANEANMEKPGTDPKQLRSRLYPVKATHHRPGEKTVAGAKVADKTIREHPYESLGIAAGVAFGLRRWMGVPAGRH
jgi:ElaB/YqjD/DUF883 family membrane-anchored ribosome-binding protein